MMDYKAFIKHHDLHPNVCTSLWMVTISYCTKVFHHLRIANEGASKIGGVSFLFAHTFQSSVD